MEAIPPLVEIRWVPTCLLRTPPLREGVEILPPPARGGSKLALRKPGFGMKLSKPRYVSCDRVAKLLRRERGRHDRIKTVSRSYQHINYTVSTTYQQCINLMADSPLAAAGRTCVSQRAESVHACAICDLATYKPPTVGQEAERAHCKRCWDCTRLCRQRNGHSACGNCMGARGRRPRLQLHDRQLNR